MSLFFTNFYFFIPEFFYISFIFLNFVFFIILSNKVLYIHSKRIYPIVTKSCFFLSIYSLILLLLLLINFLNLVEYSFISLFYYSLILNEFVYFFKIVIVIVSILFFLLGYTYFKFEKIVQYEFIILLSFVIFSILLFISSYNLISLYISLEFLSLSLYILVAMKQLSKYSTEAALKYFILGVFSSGFLLYGFSFLYGFTGLINFDDLKYFFFYFNFFETSLFFKTNLILSLIFITLGFLFKLIIVPFHMWAPDVYEGAPTYITAFLSIIPKLAFLVLFIRFYIDVFFSLYFYWYNFIILLCFISLVIGSFTAFYQIKLKRLLIYSAIVNNSFFLLSFSGGTFLNLQSFILYLYFYIILIFGLFTLLLSLRRLNNFFLIKKIYELKYLFFINPILALTFSFFLFSIAGIPPFIGFFGKFYIFYSLLDISVFFIIVFFILLSIFSVFYYIRLINIMFFSIFSKIFYIDNWLFLVPISRIKAFILFILLFLNLAFFFDPSFYLLKAHFLTLNLVY